MTRDERRILIEDMRRHTPRRGPNAGDQAALLVFAGFITGLALVLFSAHLALNL